MLIVYKTFLRICHISVPKVLMSLRIFSECFSVRTAIGCFSSICQFYFLPFYFLSLWCPLKLLGCPFLHWFLGLVLFSVSVIIVSCDRNHHQAVQKDSEWHGSSVAEGLMSLCFLPYPQSLKISIPWQTLLGSSSPCLYLSVLWLLLDECQYSEVYTHCLSEVSSDM